MVLEWKETPAQLELAIYVTNVFALLILIRSASHLDVDALHD